MTANSFFVYRHIRLDTNQPFYIGIGKKPKKFNTFNSEYARAFQKSNRNKFWKRIVAKTDYKVEIIFETNNYELLLLKEIEFIKLYGRKDIGIGTLTNLTDGGEGALGSPMTKENKQILLEINKGNKYSLGRVVPKEVREKISNSKKGKKLSEQHIKKMIASKTGKPNPKKSEHMRSRGKYVLDTFTGIYYESLIEACEATEYNYKSARDKLYKKSSSTRFIRAYDLK